MNKIPDLRPSESLEESLVDWCRRLMKDPDIRADDNFLDIGGHSLMAAQLVSLALIHHGAQLDIRQLFTKSLAEAAASASKAAEDVKSNRATTQKTGA